MEKKRNWATGAGAGRFLLSGTTPTWNQPEICYMENKHLSGKATVLAIENRIQSDILLKAGFGRV